MSKVNDTPKPRNFNVQPFERPTGYDKRMTREMPREAADNSNYSVKIRNASYHYQTPSLYPAIADENLADRVAAVHDVVNSLHTVEDYPGESNWFIYNAAYTGDAYMTFTLAPGKKLKAQRPFNGTYTNSIQVCVDGMSWETLELGVDYEPVVLGITTGSEESGNVVRYNRYAVANRSRYDESTGTTVVMFAWINKLDNSVVFTSTNVNPVVEDYLWTCAITSSGDVWTQTSDTVSAIVRPNEIYLRGRLARGSGECCPCFNVNADAITKVEGDLLDLLDATGRTWACGVPYQFGAIFSHCTALTDASGLKFPTQIPGRGLIHRLYQSMFEGCTALTAAPSLADINVSSADNKQAIFQSMFYGCSALEVAPALPKASWLPFACYKMCFQGCTHLKSIKIEGLNGIQGDALWHWMQNAGSQAEGVKYFYHPNCGKRFRYPSGGGIPEGWTPVPELDTKLYFSVQGGGGKVSATKSVGTEQVEVQNGEPILRGTAVVITPTADAGFVFDKWLNIPAGFTEVPVTHALSTSFYGYDVDDNFSAVAQFRTNKNLRVIYNLEGTTTHLAFSRYTAGDDTQAGQTMFAWTPGDVTNTTLMTGIGLIYTDTVAPTVDSTIYKKDASDQWFTSDAHFEEVEGSIWTDEYTCIVFDNATTYANSIRISVTGGSTYYNTYKSFCALTAAANASLTIDVYQSDGTTHVATEDLHWSDSVTDNPRNVTVASPGICLSRNAN